jgi:hypothetical protein
MNPKETAFLIHVWYEDVFFSKIVPFVIQHVNDVDIYINFVKEKTHPTFIEETREKFPNATITFSENPGRDIRGYMNMLSCIYEKGITYKNYVFIHTKTQIDSFGQRCLHSLLTHTIGSKETLNASLALINQTNYAMSGSHEFLTKGFWTEEEKNKTFDVLKRLGVKTRDVTFIAGTMFIVRASIVDKHLRKPGAIELFSADFVEDGTKHSGWHHAWERVFGTLVIEEGLKIFPCDNSKIHSFINQTYVPTDTLQN